MSKPTRKPSSTPPPEQAAVSRRIPDWLIGLGIVVLALGLRLVCVAQLRHSPLFTAPQLDELYHDQWAQAIVAGEQFIEGPYFRAPLYPYLLAGVYALAGHDYLAARIVQSLLGALSCGLVFLVGRLAFSRRVGILAGLGAATYWILIHYDGELLIAPLKVFLYLLTVWLLLRARYQPSLLRFGLAGAALGLAALARPNILLFAPVVALWIILLYRGTRRTALLRAAAFALAVLGPIAPVTVRNYVVGHDLVLIASQGGLNFYIGNNPASDGITAILPGTPGDWWGGYHAAIAQAEQDLGRQLKPSEVSDYYYARAGAFFRTQPGPALTLLARKFWIFWNRQEVSNNKNIYFWTHRFTPLLNWLPLGFGIVGPLGILGLVLCRRRALELFPLWGFVLVYMLSIVAFFCTARYRTPVIGVLLVLGANAVCHVVDTIRQGRWRALAGQLLVLGGATAFVNAVPAVSALTSDGQSLRMLGAAYNKQGRKDLALECARQAVELEPDYVSARYDLGTALAQRGLLPEAIAQFQAATQPDQTLRPGETPAMLAKVHHNLATALVQSGDLSTAVGHYGQAAELDPDGGDATLFLNLGSTLEALQRYDEACGAYELAVDRSSGGSLETLSRAARQRLAWLLATCPDAAVRNGPRAVEHARMLCPAGAACALEELDTLAAALAECGQFNEARNVLARAIEEARTAGNERMLGDLTARQALYAAGQPYRLPQP